VKREVRVCHVITLLELGGAQDNTLYTVGSLRPPFRAMLVAGPGGILDDEARRLADVEVRFVPALVRPIRPLRDLRAVTGLARLFRRLRPDIVHTHSSKAGIIGRAAARAAGVPIVVHSIHGFGFHDGQPRWLRAALVGLERAAAPLTTHFIAVSRANLDRGAALGIVDPARASVIRSGIRVAAFGAAAAAAGPPGLALARRALGLPPGVPVVGMIACLKPQKAPLDFVDAAARVAAARPDAHFVIVGDGELRARVEARARAVGLEGRLHLPGWRRDIPEVMAALDIVVLTSLWEGLPRVVPEAIAAGRPIVATAVDGTAEILRDGDNALLAAPRDRAGIAERILRLLQDPGLGPRLVERARPLLREFDIEAMVRAQEDLYHKLLEAAANAARRRAA
jgi:glycosyltransferase involved in cell wall biosynthesis